LKVFPSSDAVGKAGGYSSIVELLTDNSTLLNNAFANKVTFFTPIKSNVTFSVSENIITKLDIKDISAAADIIRKVKDVTNTLSWKTVQYEAGEINYNPVKKSGVVLPAFAIRNDCLYISKYPHLLAAFMEKGICKPYNIEKVSNDKVRLFFANLYDSDRLYSVYTSLMYGVDFACAVSKINITSSAFPAFGEISPFGYSGEIDTVLGIELDDDIVEVKCKGPLGLMSVPVWFLGGITSRFQGAGAIPLWGRFIAELVPVLDYVQQSKKKKISEYRLQKIFKAYRKYYKNHGKPALNLGELIAEQFITAEDAISPMGEGKEKYVLFPIKRESFTPTTPLAHDPLFREASGGYMLFADGHIEWLSAWRMGKILGLTPSEY
jgi:hypothetical protein